MAELQVVAGELAACCRVFDGSQRKRKQLLLRQAARCSLDQPSEVKAYHECLLFVAAFPDDRSIHRRAESELRRLASATRRLCAGSRRAARFLRESGVPGSATSLTPSFDLLQWLIERFPGDVAGAWTDDFIGEELEEFMHVLAAPVEYDGTVDQRLGMRQWLGLARGRQPEIHWLAARLACLRDHHRLEAPMFNAIFDHLNLDIWWQLRHGPTSRTLCRFPPRTIFLHAPRTQGPTTLPSLATIIRQPLRSVTRLHGLAARRLIETARCALASRGRETDPVTCANPREVTLIRLDRGIDVLLLGLQPDRRLPIENFLGYVAAKNRIPVAYGGAWLAFQQCTIGINVFDTFRGGESAFLFAQVLRVYVRLFHIRHVFVDPYQFGQDNDEAIKSGAFWFYHRLGFRPTDPELSTLASRESKRIAAHRRYRSSPQTLRRLADGNLCLNVDAGQTASPPPFTPGDLALAVTQWIGRRFNGDRAKAMAWSTRRMIRELKAGRRRNWNGHERRAFDQLAPLMAMIPDLGSWTDRERRSLLSLMRAKGGAREEVYLRALLRHPRLHSALRELTARPAWTDMDR